MAQFVCTWISASIHGNPCEIVHIFIDLLEFICTDGCIDLTVQIVSFCTFHVWYTSIYFHRHAKIVAKCTCGNVFSNSDSHMKTCCWAVLCATTTRGIHTDGKQQTRHIGTYVYVSIDCRPIESSILIPPRYKMKNMQQQQQQGKNQAF